MTAAYLWAIERIDADGEPNRAGDFLKLGLRRTGESGTLWIDRIDAEALADGIRALFDGRPAPGDLAPIACETCRKPLAVGDFAFQVRPGGARCMVCPACAPTVAEEVGGIISCLDAGGLPAGFRGRSDARAWVNRVRGVYSMRVKRLARILPLEPPAIESDLEFKEPPATAKEIEAEPLEDD